MRILLKVPLSPYSGYGNDGIGIVRALIKAGVDVYLDPTVVQAPVPPEVAHILTKEVRAPFDMILSHVDPMQLAATDAMRDSSDFVVGWTMWEYSNMRNMSKRTTARKRWRNFDAMVAYDPVTADGLREFYRGDIIVQQGGYHPEDWQPLERDWADPRFYFCQIGVLSDRKNPFLSIQAYSELQQEHDDFREFARLSLKTTVPGLHSKMEDVYPGLRIFYDSWPQSTVRQYYASNHVLLAPSRGEGKNMPALEFLSTGGSVIATNWGGHALALDTPLPTPRGWTTMGEVGVGSVLLDEHAQPCVVTAKSNILYEDCYRVTFSDGTSVVASEGHLWSVTVHGGNVSKVLTTKELLPYMKHANKPRLPDMATLHLPDRDLRVDPYVLGLWLADGESAGSRISVGTADVAEVRSLLSQHGEVLSEVFGDNALGEGYRLNLKGLKPALRELGLVNNKHIPPQYLRAGTSQRLELLRGLMDGDGTVSARGQCFFDNTNRRLLKDVAELARSLGIKVTSGKVGTYGQRRLSFYTDQIVFGLERKVARQEEYGTVSKRASTRTIRSIEPTVLVPTQCVTVDSPNSLYLCGEGFAATHNTQWLHPDYAYALDYTLKPIPKYPNTLNASASLEHMKALMLHAFHNREEVKRKGEIGSVVIPQLSSWDSVVSRLFEKIGESSPKGEEVMWKFRTAHSAASG